MFRIISIGSFCRGAGKSNLAANLAVLLAREGHRVCLIDADYQASSLHILFGLRQNEIGYQLQDYMAGSCAIEQTAYDVSARLIPGSSGRIYVVPTLGGFARYGHGIKRDREMELLSEGFERLRSELALDLLMLDTHAGLNEETLVTMALTDVLAIILDIDRQDCRGCLGTAVTVDVARKLDIAPHILMIVNRVPQIFDSKELKAEVERTYNCEVAGILPQLTELMALGSSELLVLRYPNSPFTAVLQQVARRLVDLSAG